jgi:hypothetical protein
LFQPVNPVAIACFRVVFAAVLAYALWPRGLEPGAWAGDWPAVARFFDDVVLSPVYRCAIYVAIVWFALGWRSRLAGAVLFALLVPHALLAKGRVSRHVLLAALLCLSLLRSTAIWRPARLRRLDAGPIWPIRLVQIQLSALYAINAWRKTTPEYLSGDVLMALSAARPNFIVDLSDGYMTFGDLGIPVALLAWATVAVEYWLAIGWWIPGCIVPTALIGVAFHLFLKGCVIRIFMLDVAAMCLYLAFLLPMGLRIRRCA